MKIGGKVFELFQVEYFVKKQAYKFKLSKKWKIHDIFHVSLLEQNISKKRRVDKNVTELDFEASNSKEYEVKAIWDSVVYSNELEKGYLLGLYYLVE